MVVCSTKYVCYFCITATVVLNGVYAVCSMGGARNLKLGGNEGTRARAQGMQ